MLLWKDDNEFMDLYDNYAKNNCDLKGGFRLPVADFMSLKYTGTSILYKTCALDYEGELIEKQICEYMKYEIADDVINKIIDEYKAVNSGKDVDNFDEELSECRKNIIDANNNATELKTNIDGIKNYQYNPRNILNNMTGIINEIKSYDENSIEEKDKKFDEFKVEYKNYIEYTLKIQRYYDDSLDNIQNYEKNIESAKEKINSVKIKLDQKKSEMVPESYNAIAAEIEDMNNEISGLDGNLFHISENREELNNQKMIISQVSADMSDIRKDMEDIAQFAYALSVYDDTGQFFERMENCVNKANISIMNFDINKLYNSFSTQEDEENNNTVDIIDFTDKIRKDGIINYIVSGGLSDGKIEDINSLPSGDKSLNGGADWTQYDETTILKRKVLISQYVLDKFDSYTDDGLDSLKYQLEYIISGKYSDRENEDVIIDKLLLIREGLNLLFLLGDNAKRQEAYDLALLTTGFTGLPVVIRVTWLLIMGAWAFAESVVDVKDLLDGYKVQVMKTEENWNLSLENASGLKSGDEESKKDRPGLNYENYLRCLLLMNSRQETVYRILDLIQIDMQKKYNSNFNIKDCILGISVESHFESKRIFSGLGFVKNIIFFKEDNFDFKVIDNFKY